MNSLRRHTDPNAHFSVDALEERTLLAQIPLPSPLVRIFQASSAAPSPQGVAVADFTGDHRDDHVSIGVNGVNIQPSENGAPARRFALGGEVRAVLPLDANGDGHPDLLVLGHASRNLAGPLSLRVLLNDGRAVFHVASKRTLDAVPDPLISATDFDGNGRPDVIVATGRAPSSFSSFLHVAIGFDGSLGVPADLGITTAGVVSMDAAPDYAGGHAGLELVLARGDERIFAFAAPSPGTGAWSVAYLATANKNFQTTFTLAAEPSRSGPGVSPLWTVAIDRPNGSLAVENVGDGAPVNLAALRAGRQQTPWIERLDATQLPDGPDGVLQLRASGVLAPLGGAVSRVQFYFDADNDGKLTAADVRIGVDDDGADGWSFSSTLDPAWASSTPFGTNFFARAFGPSGTGGTVAQLNLIL